MAGKKISELDELTYENIVKDDLITLVDSSETVISNINKKVTIAQFNNFIKNKSSVFPISFQESQIDTKAYGLVVDGAENQSRPISNTVSNKTVNLADISTLSFDKYGRVWDYNNRITSFNSVLIASGTAAGFFKGHMDNGVKSRVPGYLMMKILLVITYWGDILIKIRIIGLQLSMLL